MEKFKIEIYLETKETKLRKKVTLREYFKEKNSDFLTFFRSNFEYNEENENLIFKRLFFDFDTKENQTLENTQKECIICFNFFKNVFSITPLVNFTGGRGFHLLIDLKPTLVEKNNFEYLKSALELFYALLDKLLIQRYDIESLDKKVFVDIKHLRRPINVLHSKTKLYSIPLTEKELKEKTIDEIKELARKKRYLLRKKHRSSVILDLLRYYSVFLKERDQQMKNKAENLESLNVLFFNPRLESNKRIRPCLERILSEIKQGSYINHDQRLVILFELLDCGYTDSEIHSLFALLEDYNYNKTQYFINFSRKRNYKKYLCSNIAKIFNFDCSTKNCYVYKRYNENIV